MMYQTIHASIMKTNTVNPRMKAEPIALITAEDSSRHVAGSQSGGVYPSSKLLGKHSGILSAGHVSQHVKISHNRQTDRKRSSVNARLG
mmetsp:Transcript_27020/g.56847  ORF Transcript_27020/g.56847 Transcript_27020/m.56847 type:complete len:89 (+) Transcript_27020:313-579(+)